MRDHNLVVEKTNGLAIEVVIMENMYYLFDDHRLCQKEVDPFQRDHYSGYMAIFEKDI